MLTRLMLTLALLALAAGPALAGRACPSDAATGAGAVCEKPAHAAHAAASAHVADATLAVPAIALQPAHGANTPGCCSMPFTAAGDVVSASGATACSHGAAVEAPHAVVKNVPAKPVTHQPQRSAVAPAFGPLFLAHQALML